jgi:hypothetical protein
MQAFRWPSFVTVLPVWAHRRKETRSLAFAEATRPFWVDIQGEPPSSYWQADKPEEPHCSRTFAEVVVLHWAERPEEPRSQAFVEGMAPNWADKQGELPSSYWQADKPEEPHCSRAFAEVVVLHWADTPERPWSS